MDDKSCRTLTAFYFPTLRVLFHHSQGQSGAALSAEKLRYGVISGFFFPTANHSQVFNPSLQWNLHNGCTAHYPLHTLSFSSLLILHSIPTPSLNKFKRLKRKGGHFERWPKKRIVCNLIFPWVNPNNLARANKPSRENDI